jgi:hypothetical protein
MKYQTITTGAELSDLFDRIEALDLKFMRNRSGRMVVDVEIRASFGELCPDEGQGGMSAAEMGLLSRLLTKACECTCDQEEGDESQAADVFTTIDLDDDDGDIPIPRQ